MKIVDSAIKKPVSVIVGVLFIALFGLLSLFRIPVQLTPDVDRPIITVTTLWPGASPEEIEQEIIQRQEEQLKSVEGLVQMTSDSNDSRGVVTLEFSVGIDPDAVLLKVSNKLNQVFGYPLDAERPVISAGGTGPGGAITWLILDALPDHDELDVELYRDFAEDVIKTAIERVPGVAQSSVYGGYDRELQVIVDPQALAARQLTVQDMTTALTRENANISAGAFDEGKRRYIVRTVGQFHDPTDVEKVVIRGGDGTRVTIDEIARTKLGYVRAGAAVRQKGRPAIAINAQRETGANVLEVMDGIRQTIDELNSGPLARENLFLKQVYDETDYIKSAIGLVRSNILVGGGLAVAVLFAFLRSFSTVAIIATAIPISIVGTFLAMSLLGRNINVISLAGMSFAIGMVVDNAIVALENIFRHRQQGKSRAQAAFDGASEVWGALLASTLTTVAIFLPIVFIEDEAGQLFRDIAIAVSCSVVLSLVVAVSVIPSLANKILGGKQKSDSPLDAIGNHVRSFIANSVFRISGSTGLRLGVVIVLIGLSLGIAWAFLPKSEYLPTGNRNLVFGIILPPPGYNLDELIQIGQTIEDVLRPHWEAAETPDSPQAQNLEGPAVDNMFFVAFGRSAFMGVSSADPDRVKELIPIIQGPVFGGVPGTFAIVQQSSLFQRGGGSGRAIDIEITGPDLGRLIGLGGRIFGQVSQVVPGAQSRPIPSLDLGNPEVRIHPDRVRAADLGLTARGIGLTVNALMDGALIGGYQHQGEEIDLVLRGEDDWFRTQDIGALPIYTPRGQVVPLNGVARIEVTTGPEQISHKERSRAITIQVIPPETVALETALDDIQTQIIQPLNDSGELRPPYAIRLSGSADDLKRTREALQWNFLLALVITYLLLASLFESFLFPFVIMLSVPPALAGGILGLEVVNMTLAYQPLDILTMLGFVILIGVVVNNAILIVHQTLNVLRETPELPAKEAIRDAVSSRVRPIFMSVVTSALGMLPLVIFPGAGSELYRGLGSVVIGGLLMSTLFTLFLVPTFLSLAMDIKAWSNRSKIAKA
ncbi:MAG: efflux RND transporter permease subunit [Gemmatimonadetes bacterium]|jgi:HAE1 family hydrophobic/amphiphilic exporter-1|nr:efflux RND transporter permease subunit [Gemmatimonadota bacterium]MBT5804625.1 efflux RND transporter permease subunit [Gemmatimonadota bacterium]MBT6622788.1 efflux RND transporter permease subunit [Gemmatimonadota bacterium]MBT6906450.1 efflux RND transporter permease subunit [Gemmatimonadota bacterium]MBT7419904.1 efflux RND transporter permease subunit [Gemmatimonadota bacterium]